MRKYYLSVLLTTLLFTVFTSCKKGLNENAERQDNEVSAATLSKIKTLGFSANGVVKQSGGYIVEGDIFLEEADLRLINNLMC